MLDFVEIRTTKTKNGISVYPEFIIDQHKDLMIKGGKFHAVKDEGTGLWSRNDITVKRLVDKETLNECEDLRLALGDSVNVTPVLLANNSSKKWLEWRRFTSNLPDNYKELDSRVIFANTQLRKTDYATMRLPYAIGEGSIEAYDKIMSTLYDPEERQKLEWAIGCIIAGDGRRLQKFFILYGDKGTGKSTFLHILEDLFGGYVHSFCAKDLGSASAAFALEPFASNPLVAIDHDGELSRIEDNTRINSIVSHEYMIVNEKHKTTYSARFNALLFVGSNRPVKITDAKSGLLRRIIDINPSGRLLPEDEYYILADHENPNAQYKFELGAIAFHCLQVYKKLGFTYYSRYKPRDMMSETNEFYNFILDESDFFYENSDFCLLKTAWKRYQDYCEDSGIRCSNKMIFKNELKNYFESFREKSNGYSNVFRGFKDPYGSKPKIVVGGETKRWLEFNCTKSLFDDIFKDCLAQYAKEDGSPKNKWEKVVTKLIDIVTSKLHWVKPPGNLICIDFDIKGETGEKDLEANLEAANKWKPTYAEVSKSGQAIHLYYYYEGDVNELSSIIAPYIEIKTFSGNASLRRMVTKCNDIPIATLTSGLPLKEKGDMLSEKDIKNEKHLRALVLKALLKKVHPDTSSNINFIKEITDKAYESKMPYDITDMYQDIFLFAAKSSHQAERCVNLVGEMHLSSEDKAEVVNIEYEDDGPIRIRIKAEGDDGRLVFFDIEIYRPDKETDNPGLFLVCWKYEGTKTVNAMVNPKAHEIEDLMKFKLIGFNNRGYDNMMLWGASLGYSNQQLYDLSQDIIVGHKRVFPQAADISYTDVYDFATEKMSLKKWEIKLGITHKEMGIPWDEPAPLKRWNDIIEYCKNDVIATEAVFHARAGDFMARKIQVELVNLLHPDDDIHVCVNDTTNTLSKRIIFGKEKKPQSEFNYRDMSKPVGADEYAFYREHYGDDYVFRVFDNEGLPQYRDYIPGEELPSGWSILPFFPGYVCDKNEKGKLVSTYLGETIGEGGRVYSVPGYYEWVWDGDISSQHPHSIIAEVLFGPKYTKIFREIVEARVAIKHKDFEKAGSLLGGALKPYLSDEHAAALAQALKIVINSIYGLTSAGFDNEFRDSRNFDNIVAKRGALFMTLLKREVERRGAFVCHIKTDSIKIPDASKDAQDFVIKFGREYGYEFETEDVFTKFALFNDAAYLGYSENGDWVTKADQFKKEKQPFVFKTLFSHEPYEFSDFCETKSVTEGALYLDLNEELGDPVDELYEKECKKLVKMQLKDKATPDEITEQINFCERLREEIPSHHNFVFVGRVGQFTPIKKGFGAGTLYRKSGDTISAATGSKGYLWLESEYVKEHGMMDAVDISYYQKKVDKVREVIDKTVRESTNGSLGVDYFISSEVPEMKEPGYFGLMEFMNIPEGASEEIPFDADYVVKTKGDTQ